MSEPRILFLDVENIAELIWAWGIYEVNAIEVERPGHLLSMAYKWRGDKKTQVIAQCDFKDYKPKSASDKNLCKFIWKLLDEADVIIGHNAQSFDVKKINYRFIVNGLTPTSPYKVVDTLVSLKKVARGPSHKLDAIGKVMKIGRKLEHEGWPLWKKCYLGDKRAWAKMKLYNKQDVELLEKWYDKLLPWISNHPNYNLYAGTIDKCPNCGGRLTRQGYTVTRVCKLQRFKCQSCGAWSTKPLKPFSVVR
jgi:hypothetical protein